MTVHEKLEEKTTADTRTEIELWNNIDQIVELKRKIPNLETRRMIGLVHSEIARLNSQSEIIPLTNYNSATLEKTKVFSPKNTTAIVFDPSSIHIGEHVEFRHTKSMFEGNPWNVPINTWGICGKCGLVGITGIEIHQAANKTYVYKAWEHKNDWNNKKENKRMHYNKLVGFTGKMKYKEILNSNPKDLRKREI